MVLVHALQASLRLVPRRGAAFVTPLAGPWLRGAFGTSASLDERGAPFTNSVNLRPVKDSAGDYMLSFTIPGSPIADVRFQAHEPLNVVVPRVASATGARDVRLLRNGELMKLDASPPPAIASVYGASLDVSLDGLRYSVNRGLRLSRDGFVAKRSVAKTYMYVTIGAGAMLAISFLFWVAVVPDEHSRLKH